MPTIGPKTIDAAGEALTALLKMYRDKIDKAYLKADGALTLDLKAKFKAADNGDMEVETSINFVTDRIKNTVSRTVNENQGDLFPKEEEKDNVVPMKARVTMPEIWVSGLEWLIGWGYDPDITRSGLPMSEPCKVSKPYNTLNRLRDRHEIEREFVVLMDREQEWQEKYGIMDNESDKELAEAIG